MMYRLHQCPMRLSYLSTMMELMTTITRFSRRSSGLRTAPSPTLYQHELTGALGLPSKVSPGRHFPYPHLQGQPSTSRLLLSTTQVIPLLPPIAQHRIYSPI